MQTYIQTVLAIKTQSEVRKVQQAPMIEFDGLIGYSLKLLVTLIIKDERYVTVNHVTRG